MFRGGRELKFANLWLSLSKQKKKKKEGTLKMRLKWQPRCQFATSSSSSKYLSLSFKSWFSSDAGKQRDEQPL